MTRLNLVLLLAVVLSALQLVRVQYDSRRLYTEIERARNEARKLDADRERLTAEKRGQATPLRVERLAKEQLQMRPAGPAITQYVSLGGVAPAVAPAPFILSSSKGLSVGSPLPAAGATRVQP